MQIEKYINNLHRTSYAFLTKKYKNKLPSEIKIKITNPRGYIIMNRDNTLTKDQMVDFEIIKKQNKKYY